MTYVTSELKERLGIKPAKTEILNLIIFGDKLYRKQKCDVVNLILSKEPGNEVQISALTFPRICSELPTKVNLNNYPQLQSLKLADDSKLESGTPIDVLVGSDHCWDFITGNVTKSEDGPVAVESVFGWILSGVSESNDSNHFDNCDSVTNLVFHESIGLPEQEDSLHMLLKGFWETESIGIKDDVLPNEKSIPEHEEFLNEIKCDDQRDTLSSYRGLKILKKNSQAIMICV